MSQEVLDDIHTKLENEKAQQAKAAAQRQAKPHKQAASTASTCTSVEQKPPASKEEMQPSKQ